VAGRGGKTAAPDLTPRVILRPNPIRRAVWSLEKIADYDGILARHVVRVLEVQNTIADIYVSACLPALVDFARHHTSRVQHCPASLYNAAVLLTLRRLDPRWRASFTPFCVISSAPITQGCSKFPHPIGL
jgi:hypothetical protein